jgi:hypothetical protein
MPKLAHRQQGQRRVLVAITLTAAALYALFNLPVIAILLRLFRNL